MNSVRFCFKAIQSFVGLGFNVRIAHSDNWDPAPLVGEWGWGGAAGTHYCVSPKDDFVVVTMEPTMTFNFRLETGLKGPIDSAIQKWRCRKISERP